MSLRIAEDGDAPVTMRGVLDGCSLSRTRSLRRTDCWRALSPILADSRDDSACQKQSEPTDKRGSLINCQPSRLRASSLAHRHFPHCATTSTGSCSPAAVALSTISRHPGCCGTYAPNVFLRVRAARSACGASLTFRPYGGRRFGHESVPFTRANRSEECRSSKVPTHCSVVEVRTSRNFESEKIPGR